MSDSSSKVVIGLLLVGSVVFLMCCGGGVAMYVWIDRNGEEFAEGFAEGFTEELQQAGQDEFARQVRVEIENNPVIVEHIGSISSFEYDFDRSMDEPGDTYVFYLSGDRGSGTLRADCITIDADHEDVPRGQLIMDSGETYQLFPNDPLN